MRAIALAAILTVAPCAMEQGRVLNLGASQSTGYPRNNLTGASIISMYGQKMFPAEFATRIGATIGGTAGPAPNFPDACSDAGGVPPISSCPGTTFPACNINNNRPLCDMACAGARMNTSIYGCLPICNESGGSCAAASQVGYVAAEILADATPNNIKAVVFASNVNDATTWCAEFATGITTAWEAWKTALTAAFADLRAAVDGSASPGAVLIYVPQGRYLRSAGVVEPALPNDEYWSYINDAFGVPSDLLNCLLVLNPPYSDWGGIFAEVDAFTRALAATYGFVHFEYGIAETINYWRFYDGIYATLQPPGVCAGKCGFPHINHFGHLSFGAALQREYLVATGATDTDSDGLADSYETLIGTNPNNADSDGDGVKDGTELGSSWVFGGARDPLNRWDVFDPNGDGVVDDQDISAMKRRVYLGIPSRSFDQNYQRLPPPSYTIGDDPEPREPWDTREVTAGLPYPNSYPTEQDLLLLEQQRGHRFDCLPDYSNCFGSLNDYCQHDEQCLSGVCGCDGDTSGYRRCLVADTMTGGYTQDPRQCTNLAAMQPCLLDSECASNNCDDAIVSGIFACVAN